MIRSGCVSGKVASRRSSVPNRVGAVVPQSQVRPQLCLRPLLHHAAVVVHVGRRQAANITPPPGEGCGRPALPALTPRGPARRNRCVAPRIGVEQLAADAARRVLAHAHAVSIPADMASAARYPGMSTSSIMTGRPRDTDSSAACPMATAINPSRMPTPGSPPSRTTRWKARC